MRVKNLIPLPIRNKLRGLLLGNKSAGTSPIEVVKANTREAFDYFYKQDDFLGEHYLEPRRIALYELVADHCVGLVKNSGVSGKVRVADIGCGTGEMLQILRSRLVTKYEIELVGVDFAASAIRKAQKLLPSATLVVDDIYQNNLPSGYFDLVLSLETLEHLQQPKKALEEGLRICKPGGQFVITVPEGDKDSWDGHVNFWNVSQFSEFLSPHGFVEVKLLQDETVIMARLVKPLEVQSTRELQ